MREAVMVAVMVAMVVVVIVVVVVVVVTALGRPSCVRSARVVALGTRDTAAHHGPLRSRMAAVVTANLQHLLHCAMDATTTAGFRRADARLPKR